MTSRIHPFILKSPNQFYRTVYPTQLYYSAIGGTTPQAMKYVHTTMVGVNANFELSCLRLQVMNKGSTKRVKYNCVVPNVEHRSVGVCLN